METYYICQRKKEKEENDGKRKGRKEGRIGRERERDRRKEV